MELNVALFERLLNVCIYIIVLLFLYLIVIALVKRFAYVLSKGVAGDPRIQGMIRLFLTFARWSLILFAVFMIMNELSINIAPLLAGAGIVGIALSFATQAFLKDIASGINILITNHFRAGDIIILNGIQGVVEHISLMKTTIRDKQTLYYIPNGQISVVGVVQTAHQGRSRLPYQSRS